MNNLLKKWFFGKNKEIPEKYHEEDDFNLLEIEKNAFNEYYDLFEDVRKFPFLASYMLTDAKIIEEQFVYKYVGTYNKKSDKRRKKIRICLQEAYRKAKQAFSFEEWLRIGKNEEKDYNSWLKNKTDILFKEYEENKLVDIEKEKRIFSAFLIFTAD